MGKKALIIVDVQNDFTTGPLGSREARAAIPFIEGFLSKFFADGNTIIYTRDTHDYNYLKTQEGRHLPVEHCLHGSWGWNVVDRIGYLESDRVKYLNKNGFGYDDWESEHLDQFDEVYMMGFCTDICVITNALMIKALYPETPITVVANGCAGTTPEKDAAALEVMRSCQIRIL